jgi:hypothetical protein
MNLKYEIEDLIINGAVAFHFADQKVLMKEDTAQKIINKVLDYAIEKANKAEPYKVNIIRSIEALKEKNPSEEEMKDES